MAFPRAHSSTCEQCDRFCPRINFIPLVKRRSGVPALSTGVACREIVVLFGEDFGDDLVLQACVARRVPLSPQTGREPPETNTETTHACLSFDGNL